MAPVVSTLVPSSVVYASGTSFIVGTAGTATATVGADDPDNGDPDLGDVRNRNQPRVVRSAHYDLAGALDVAGATDHGHL